jgi:pilus assembly protein CpaD
MGREEKTMQSVIPAIRRARRCWRAAAAVVLAGTALAACQTLEPASPMAEVVAPSIPTDARLRHPIKLREGTRAVELFIGSHRTDLTPSQRAQVKFFGQGWNANATGGVAIRVPTGTPNEEAAPASPPTASW